MFSGEDLYFWTFPINAGSTTQELSFFMGVTSQPVPEWALVYLLQLAMTTVLTTIKGTSALKG